MPCRHTAVTVSRPTSASSCESPPAAAHDHPETAGAGHLCCSGLSPHMCCLSSTLGCRRDGCTGCWAASATRRMRCRSCTWPAARARAPSQPCWQQSFRQPATGWPHTPGAQATILVGRSAAPVSNSYAGARSSRQGGLACKRIWCQGELVCAASHVLLDRSTRLMHAMQPAVF